MVNSAVNNDKSKKPTRVLATKTPASEKCAPQQPLNLRQVSEAEFEASRNSAYTYLVK